MRLSVRPASQAWQHQMLTVQGLSASMEVRSTSVDDVPRLDPARLTLCSCEHSAMPTGLPPNGARGWAVVPMRLLQCHVHAELFTQECCEIQTASCSCWAYSYAGLSAASHSCC